MDKATMANIFLGAVFPEGQPDDGCDLSVTVPAGLVCQTSVADVKLAGARIGFFCVVEPSVIYGASALAKASSAYVRAKMNENSFMRKILPPVAIPNTEVI